SVRAVRGVREALPICDVGDGIAIRIDRELVQRLGRERHARGGPRRVHDGGRMDVHDQDRLVRLAWLGEGIQIREVQARVSMRKAEIGTGVMVRHGSFTPLSRASRGQRGSQRPTSSVWPTSKVYRAYWR